MTFTTLTHTDWTREQFNFAAFDAKGRQIGCAVLTCSAEFAAHDKPYGYTEAPGHYYAAKVQMTKDGVKFGASQSVSYFVTITQRDAFTTQRVNASRKAAAKKAA